MQANRTALRCRMGTVILCLGFGLCMVSGRVPAAQSAATPATLQLLSPDGRLELQIQTHGMVTYRVSVDGQRILNDSRLGLRLRDGAQLGRQYDSPFMVVADHPDNVRAP